MSMIGNLLRVSYVELEAYLNDSSLLEKRVYPDEDAVDPSLLDVDKSWEGIWFILTGCGVDDMGDAEPPLSWTFFSGQIIDESQDMGYGPAHFCTPTQVQEVAKALDEISISQFREKFENAEATMSLDIYPGVLWSDGENSFEFLKENFEQMKDFFKKASATGEAVITFIN